LYLPIFQGVQKYKKLINNEESLNIFKMSVFGAPIIDGISEAFQEIINS